MMQNVARRLLQSSNHSVRVPRAGVNSSSSSSTRGIINHVPSVPLQYNTLLFSASRCPSVLRLPATGVTNTATPTLTNHHHHHHHHQLARSFSTNFEQQSSLFQNHGDHDDNENDNHVDLSNMSNDELQDTSTIPGWDLIHCPPRTFPRGALVGTVVSTKMQKTINVAVDRYRIVPKIRKRMRYTRKFFAHDETEVANMGDLVMITPCQRLSRHKHFMLREIIRPKGQL
jgi:small subunit ribosomal protein S17